MRVVVTRPENEAPRWVDALRERGFDALSLPLIRIVPAPDLSAIETAWANLDEYRAAMFVSGNAVRHFFAARPGTRWPATVRAWATGPGTRQALLDAGVPDALVDVPASETSQFDSEALWNQVAGQVTQGDRVLVVRGSDAATGTNGRDWLADQVGRAGAQAGSVIAYLRMAPQWSAKEYAEVDQLAGDAVWLFSSSQAIANLKLLLPRREWTPAKAVATHPRIAQAARDAGFAVVCESRPTMDAVASALESFR
ncbi:MAG TPA: uroporphyrinogen-III synthase [Ramlibacter sp.]|nr:uroporphyrinogen-III synthase [Ramlibacter sp.]